VKRIERGNVIVESGRIEGMIPRDQLIPRKCCASATASAPT